MSNADIFLKIERDFGSNAPQVHLIIEKLEAKTRGLIGKRILRSIIFLANGDLNKLQLVIELAKTDWRDVLLQAEYSYPDMNRVRDFEKTFHELGLL